MFICGIGIVACAALSAESSPPSPAPRYETCAEHDPNGIGTNTDPKLPRASVDLILMVDVYHEFDHPFEMVQAMCQALKPGGRIVFVEFRAEDPEVPIKLVHKMTEAQVRKEMSVQPLEWVETIGVLPQQHLIVFRKLK